MTQLQSYEEILQKGWDEIPEPQFLPDGSYRFRCTGAKVMPPKNADQSARCVFAMEPQEAMDDVNSDALAALGEGYDISENVIFPTIWLSKGTDWAKVRAILTKLGVNLADYDTIEASLKAAKGCEVIGYVTMRHYIDKANKPQQENVIQTFAELS